MKVYKEKYVSEAYKKILNDLLNNPEYITKPRGMEVREIINCVIEIEEPNFNMYKNETRSSQERYIGSELLWYFSGTKKTAFIENYASMWTKLKNEKNEANSAYGFLIFEEENEHHIGEYEWAIKSLIKDKDSRQAIMHFNKPYHLYEGNKDQVCTLIALLHIRDEKLHMTLTMRSNDVILGFMTDYTFFNILHQQAYLHLKKYYKKLQMGSYTHISHSMHLYSKHYELVNNMLKHEFTPHATPALNTSIIKESGAYKDEYNKIFLPVVRNTKIKIESTDNDVINWCLKQINDKT